MAPKVRGGNFKLFKNFCGTHKDWDGGLLTRKIAYRCQAVIQGRFSKCGLPWVIRNGYKKLHWLPVEHGSLFKTATLVYKFHHTDLPKYFAPKFGIKSKTVAKVFLDLCNDG